jgi:hypothetical protein
MRLGDPTNNIISGGESKGFYFIDTFYHETIRDQPMKVKISKQMKERYKSYEAELKAQSDRSNHLLEIEKRDKGVYFKISDLRPKHF